MTQHCGCSGGRPLFRRSIGRCEVIISGKARGQYARAASLLASCAEAITLEEGAQSGTLFVSQSRDRYPRHVAFRTRAGHGHPADTAGHSPADTDSPMTDLEALDQLVEVITVDCHDVDEQITAFHSVFTNEVTEPTWATIVGVPVLVLDADIRDTGTELTAHCRHNGDQQDNLLHRPGVPARHRRRVDPCRLPSMPRPAALSGRDAPGLAAVLDVRKL